MGWRVILVDPNVTQREGVRRLLEHEGFDIIAETSTAQSAVRLALRWRPDVMLMAVELPDGNGISVLRDVLAANTRQRVVLIGSCLDDAMVDAAIGAGALGVLSTECSLGEVCQALRRVIDDEVVVSASFTTRGHQVVRRSAAPGDERAERTARSITHREREVLQAIVDGLSCREAASRLFMSHKTLKNHLCSIYAKLGAHDRTQAVLSAVRLGIVRLG